MEWLIYSLLIVLMIMCATGNIYLVARIPSNSNFKNWLGIHILSSAFFDFLSGTHLLSSLFVIRYCSDEMVEFIKTSNFYFALFARSLPTMIQLHLVSIAFWILVSKCTRRKLLTVINMKHAAASIGLVLIGGVTSVYLNSHPSDSSSQWWDDQTDALENSNFYISIVLTVLLLSNLVVRRILIKYSDIPAPSTEDANETQMMRTVRAMMLLFLFCWVPNYMDTLADAGVGFPILVLAASKSALNPILCIITNSDFRQIMKKKVCCK